MAENPKAAWHQRALRNPELSPEARAHHEQRLAAISGAAPAAKPPPNASAAKPPRAARKKAPATAPAGAQRAATPQPQQAAPSAAAAYTAAHAHLHEHPAQPAAAPKPQPTAAPPSSYSPQQTRALVAYHERERGNLAARGDPRGAAVHAQKAAAAREALAAHPGTPGGASAGTGEESDTPQIAAARLKAARGRAEHAEASIKHEAAMGAYELSRGAETHLATVHGSDSPQVHQQRLKSTAIAQELSRHQVAQRRGSATAAEALHELAAHRAGDRPGDALAQERERGAAARAETARKSVQTAQARTARAQKRRTMAEQVNDPAALGHQQDAERSRRHAADTQVQMKGLHEQVANHQHEIARLSQMHGARSAPVQQERAAMLTKQAQAKTLASEHERHIADATHSQAQAAQVVGDRRRAAALHDTARVREASVGMREAQARTATFKAQHPAEPAGRDPLRERTERIKSASEAFHQLVSTGSNELIKHMQQQVGH